MDKALAIDMGLRRNVFWAFFANGAGAFLSWLLLAVLTKVAGVEEVGMFGLAQAVALPIHTFFTFKLRIIQTTDNAAEFLDDEYRNFRILSGVLNFLFATMLAILLYHGRTYLLIIVLSLSYSVVIYREFYVSILQKHERNDIVSISTIAQGILGLILFVTGYLVTSNLLVGITGILLARLMSVIFIDGRLSTPFGSWGKRSIWEDISNRDSRKRYLTLFRTGIPMGGVALLSTLFASIPRLVLDKFVSIEAVGFYSALSSVVVVMSLFINSLGQSFTPRLSVIYSRDKEEFHKKIGLLALISILFVALCLVFSWFLGRELLTILFTRAYALYKPAFFKLIVGGGFLVFFSIMNIAISAQRAFKIQFPIYAICTVVTLVSSLMLIPRFGLDGAVYSYILCNITGFALTCLVYAANMRKTQ